MTSRSAQKQASADLAALPGVYEVLEHPRVARIAAELDHALLVAEIQRRLALHRDAMRDGRAASAPVLDELAAELEAAVAEWSAARLRPVINLTGTLLHTNLGRAPLSSAAIDALIRAAGTVNLEYDLATGRRGDRDSLVEELLCRLTGAEAATVVNNNAAAVYLVLNTLANRRQVVISRGELVEIGASFRIPDIIRASGARLVEVGTTNRTHLADYRSALEAGGRLLLKVHTSNYRVVGFTHETTVAELAALATQYRAPVVVDLGSGALADPERFGIRGELTVQDALRAGADVVTFSGDKLLGGPQCGIAIGNSECIKRLKRNPMKRALRCDKLILAALEATLQAYLSPQALPRTLPAYRMIARNLAEIEVLAAQVRPHLDRWASGRAAVKLVPGESQVGSGSAPDAGLPTLLLALRPLRGGPEPLARELRALDPPVVGRVHGGAVLLDLRALLDPDALIAALRAPERSA